MNSRSLSKADIETILINLNASKEDLCNRGLWNIAEEYQQIIYKILVNFADTLGEKLNEYVTELLPVSKESINDNSDEMKEEIRKAATGIHQVYTKLLDAGFNSNTAINIMIAMISVTKIQVNDD